MSQPRLLAVFAVLGGFLLSAAASRGDEPGLKVGDLVPEFQCADDQGHIWSSSDHIGKQLVVLYFYPSDFSFCCTRQAVRYRDHTSELFDQDVEVIGISGDAVQAHRLFKAVHMLNFTLLADEDGCVAQQFGVPLRNGGKAVAQNANGQAIVDETGKTVQITRNITTARWTFIIGKDGHILYRETAVSPVKDSQQVLDFINHVIK